VGVFAVVLVALGLGRVSPALATTHLTSQTLTSSTTWTSAGSPYVLDGNVTVAAGVTLTINPGVIVKFNGTTRTLTVNGTLNAAGSSGSLIYFTSLQDDSVGGDTGGDGATSGARSQWNYIRVQSGAQATMSYVVARYGGYTSAMLNIDSGASLTLQHSTVEHNGNYGVGLNGSSTGATSTATISDSTLDDNYDGVNVQGNSHVEISARSMITANRHEGFVQGSKSGGSQNFILDSDIAGNSGWGLDVSVSSPGSAQYVPYGHRDNIYDNNGGASQAAFSTPSIDWSDWVGNYWGAAYFKPSSDGRCGSQGQQSPGVFRIGSSTPAIQYESNYALSSPTATCWYGPVRVYSGMFSPVYIGSSLYVQPYQGFGFGGADGNASDLAGLLDDPVNTATGNFYHSELDASLPGIGIPFRFVRSYNSLDASGGVLSRGWTFSYNESLLVHPNGDVTFRTADGARLDFVKQSGGSFVGSAGVLAQLTAVSGGYKVTSPDQRVHSFDSSGHLTSLVDRNGQGLSFSYASGRLTTITDSVGRTITLSYSSGLLSTLTLPGSRQVSYGYNSSGQLTSVTDLRGKVWSYVYDSNGMLQKETDPRSNQAFKVLYDTTSLRASDTYDAFNNHTSFAYNATTQTATVTDPLGKVTTDVYAGNALQSRTDPLSHTTSYSYDSAGNLSSVTDPRSNTTTMTYDTRGNMLTKTAPSPLSYTQTWTYNSRNDVSSYQDGRGKTTTYGYDTAGNLTSLTDPLSHVTSIGYDSGGKGLVVSTTDPRGKTTSYGYDSSGNLNQIVDPDGNTTTLTHDADSGDLLTVVDPRGNVSGCSCAANYTISATYDAAGHPLTTTDQLGNVTTFTYDDNGNRLTVKNALNKTWTYAYNDANEISSVTDPNGATITNTYTVRGELAAVTDQLGHKTSFSYDDAGRLAAKVMPRGNESGATPSDYTWTYGYDGNGNRTTITDPLGHETTYGYDAINRLTSVTDPLTHATTYAYDANGNLTSTTDPLSHSVSRVYNDLNRLTSITDGRSKTTTLAYDANGNLTSQADPLGNETTFGYDDASRLTSSVDPRGNVSGCGCASTYTTSYAYDEAGNRTTITDPLSHVTSFVYDRDSRLHSTTDPLSHSVSYGYDAAGRLQSVTAPDSSTTTYGYNDVGDLTSRTDANLHTTSYAYDTAHRLTSVTNPLGKVWSFVYDADNELTSREDAIANAASNPSLGTTTYSYDHAGRETGIDYSDSTPDVAYGYDNANRLTSMTDGAGTKSYGYDNANRTTSIGRGSASFSYAYDAADNLTSVTDPDSTSISYGYDNSERLSSITNGSNTTSYGYDKAGNLTSKTLPNGIVESRSYDAADQLSQIAAANGTTHMTGFQVTRNAAGDPTQVSKLGGAVENYTYDNFGRLTSVCSQSSCPNSSDPKISWTYDSIGRRQTETRPSGTLTYSYNAADEITSTSDGSTTTTYSFDADGRETAKGSSSFAYDMADDLTSATVGSTTTTYSYDGAGNRLSASDGTNTTNYLWDDNTVSGMAQLARESNGSGSLIRRYLSDQDGLSTLQNGTGSFSYLRDQQGSVAQLTDSSANSEWEYGYEPFGATKSATKVDPSAPDNPLQFDSQYLDTDSGLYDLRARQYDPTAGAFLATDPLAPALTDPYVSAYAYAGNQPTTFDDPTGMRGCGILSKICHDGESAASAIADTATAATHVVVEAGEITVKIGGSIVVGTAEQMVGVVQDSFDCISGVASGEFRSASRHCLKTAALITAVLATSGAAAVLTDLLERYGATEGLTLLVKRLGQEESGELRFGAREPVIPDVTGGAPEISMDQAIEDAILHVGPEGIMEVTPNGNYQFRSTVKDAAGNVESKMGRFDVNPADEHVHRGGPHLNIETHVNGKQTENVHTPIDPSTVRPGDIP
jgi:RHS repeat-associated protein